MDSAAELDLFKVVDLGHGNELFVLEVEVGPDDVAARDCDLV